ncbi:MAG: hypothetical protein HY017_32935 [Betaproteobacteria bacterium]|nr:hypothetical protein [Betaproteobacteria bacterium]
MPSSEIPRLPEASVQELIDRLPFGVALAGTDGSIRFSNVCFRENFDPACLDCGGMGRNFRLSRDSWHPLRLARRDGREVDARAQSLGMHDSIILVVDEFSEARFTRALEWRTYSC